MSVYDFDGEKYKAASRHQKEWGERLIGELDLKGDEEVLDLGCGDGILSREIANLLPDGRVVGIDSSAGMMATAQSLAMDRLTFKLEDINSLNYDAEFDVIFSNAALHWVADHERLLGNCYRALKSGGTLRFSFGGEGNCRNFLAVVRDLMREEPFYELFRDFIWPWYMPGVEEYQRILERSPFADYRVELENADRWFASVEELVGWIEQPSLVPFISALEGDKRELFRDLAVQRMLDRTADSDGRYFETFRRITILARK